MKNKTNKQKLIYIYKEIRTKNKKIKMNRNKKYLKYKTINYKIQYMGIMTTSKSNKKEK